MELIHKAYKYTFSWCKEDFKDFSWSNKHHYDVMYGKSQKEAVNERCKYDDCYSYYELKCAIRTKRCKELDLYKQEPHPIIKTLSEKEISILTHALGVRIGDKIPHKDKNPSNYF